MNKFLTKVTALCVGLAMVAGVGVAVGSKKASEAKAADSLSYTLDFKANASDTDSSTALGTTVSDYFIDGASYVASVSSSKVYLGKSSMNGVKFGSSSAKGSLTLTLASTGQVKATKITLALAVYDSGKKVNVSINGASSGTGYSELSPSGSLTDYDVAWDGTNNLSTIKVESNIASKCRFYLDYIKVYVGGDEPVCTHDWVAGTVHAATCEEDGYTEYECSLCGETKHDDVTSALGHDYGGVIVDTAATCTEAGAGHKVCSRDSSHVENVVIPALGHNFVNGVCTVCGAEEPNETTITTTIKTYADAQGWGSTSSADQKSIIMDSNITATCNSGTNSGKVYNNNTEWRIYQGETGKVTITAENGTTLSSVTFAFSVSNTGKLSYNGVALTSGTAVAVSGTSAEFVVGNTGTATNGQIRITSISVTYANASVVPEDTFSVTYDANDSSSRPAVDMPTNVTGLEDGEICTLSGSPTRWGYTFLGWGTSASATATISSVTIDGSNETVYALWQEDHTVAGAWSDSPYTVAQAITAIDDNEHLTDVYVAGVVSKVDSFNSDNSITYWIIDSGITDKEFEVFKGKGISGANFSSKDDVEVGGEVVVNGNLTKYNTTYEFSSGSKQISYTAPSTGDIDVTFQPSVFLGVGDSGTYTASTEAENPSYSFSSDNSSVLSVSSSGAYTAVAAGTATVRVDVTSSDGNGYKEVAVTVVAVKTVSEAYDIAAALASGATTDYSIKVTGAISNLDADGKSRAVNLTDGSQVIMAFFGGSNADYATVKSTGFIGSKVSLYAKVQNYSGTYELKDITLAGVVAADADSFAAGAYKSLDGSCETGPEAVTEDQWTAASSGYAELSSADQAKFNEGDLTPYGENVVNWVDRYERIVSGSALTNFMSLTSIAGRLPYEFSEITDVNNSVAIIIIVAVTSMTLLGVTLVLRKRKHQ